MQTLQQYRDQLKAKAKADEEAKASVDDLIQRGRQMTEEVRTPFQVMQDKIREINALQTAGAITPETAALQRDKAREDFNAPMREAMRGGRNTIADINTQEAYDVVKRTRDSYSGGGGGDGKKKGDELLNKQLEQLTKIANAIEEKGTGNSIKINVRRI